MLGTLPDSGDEDVVPTTSMVGETHRLAACCVHSRGTQQPGSSLAYRESQIHGRGDLSGLSLGNAFEARVMNTSFGKGISSYLQWQVGNRPW